MNANSTSLRNAARATASRTFSTAHGKPPTHCGTGENDLPERERERLARDLAAAGRVAAGRKAGLVEARDAWRRSLLEQHRRERAVQSAVAEERNRIAREIHDTIAHAMVGVIMQLRQADLAIVDGVVGDARRHLQQAVELARYGLGEARRSIRGLRQGALDDIDLCIAAARLVERTTPQAGVMALSTVKGQPKRLPSDAEAGILRIVQEALTNVVRQAACD